MIRPGFALFAAAVLLAAFPSSASAYSSTSLSLRVYSDGFVLVSQSIAVDPRATSVQVPLISSVVSNLVATDQNGSPLSYGFFPGGGNLTVYTLGATGVTLKYETDNLTSKQGTVWTVTFTSDFNLTVILPQFSTLGSVSGTPYSVNETNTSPEMSLPPGSWRVSYGVPLEATTSGGSGSTTVPGGGTFGSPLGLTDLQLSELGALVLGAVVVALAVRWWRRGEIGPTKDLRPDDLRVLGFIQEKGGKVLEPEIRMKFALPKTSAWRQIRRLERLGYVRVVKIGSQNQIELLRNRTPVT